MPKTQISCPNCRQPVVADIDQVFDVGVDPSAKQRFLSGAFNQVSCPHCGYQGSVASLIVFHDPDKELLLTHVPPEVGLPHDEQERRLGSLINQVVNNLPQEKRKAYLLQPQAAFTLQGMVERVLEADGITKEMIEAQQQRINLIQRLVDITVEGVFTETVKQEDELIDADFFTMLRQLANAAAMGGDEESAEKLVNLQDRLVPITTFGQELQAQSKEVEAAYQALQDAGDELTRDKLLELVLEAPNEIRLSALVSLARPGMDYQFFQLLSERIDRSRGEGRTRLVKLREDLLQMTMEIDKQIEARVQQARVLVAEITKAEDVSAAMAQAIPLIDEFFVEELNAAIKQARENEDSELLDKYQQMLEILQKLSTLPPEVELIEELLEVPEDENQESAWRQIMDSHRDQITAEFLSALANITSQAQSGDNPELSERLQHLNRQALRYSMERNL